MLLCGRPPLLLGEDVECSLECWPERDRELSVSVVLSESIHTGMNMSTLCFCSSCMNPLLESGLIFWSSIISSWKLISSRNCEADSSACINQRFTSTYRSWS